MKRIFYLIPILTILSLQNAYSQTTDNIFSAMEEPDEQTGAKVTFVHDAAIETILLKKNNVTVKGTAVFSIQVFSSNQRTAKNDATNIEKQLESKFPDAKVQVNYVSPFWKVRIGAFPTREEANKFRQELMSALPNLRDQIYIVADRNK